MSTERLHPRRRESHEQEPALDDRWFEEFKALAVYSESNYIGPRRARILEQKDSFLAGEVRNPEQAEPEQFTEHVADFQQREEGLRDLKKRILESEENEVVRKSYRWRINDVIAGIRMQLEAINGNMRRFRRYNEFKYGTPSPEIVQFNIQTVIQGRIDRALSSDNPDLVRAAEEMQQVLPTELSGDVRQVQLPSADLVGRMQKEVTDEFGHIIRVPDVEGKLNAEQIRESFEHALVGMQAEGWEALVDTDGARNGIRINHADRRVEVPPQRQVTEQYMKGLIVHEIGTHVARRENGERSQLRLLGLGLDRYIRGEEGVATMREQALKGKTPDFGVFLPHLACSLANGSFDGTKRDFRGVFEVMKKYHMLKRQQLGESVEVAEAKSDGFAYMNATRAFAYGDPSTVGGATNSDIVYREGNEAIWDLVGNDENASLRFSVGKYDPTNDRHLWILTQLGITEQDLAEVESLPTGV